MTCRVRVYLFCISPVCVVLLLTVCMMLCETKTDVGSKKDMDALAEQGAVYSLFVGADSAYHCCLLPPPTFLLYL